MHNLLASPRPGLDANYMDSNEPKSTHVSTESPENCAICLDAITERAITVPCNHALFDYLCILTWLLDHDSKCPLCKTEVTAVTYDILSATAFKTFLIPNKSESAAECYEAPGRHQTSSSRRRRRHSPSPGARPDYALERRRHVYKHQLYCLHIGANQISGHRNFTPTTFALSPDLQARARKWLRRELRVFEFLDPSFDEQSESEAPKNTRRRRTNNAEFLLEYVVAMLRRIEIKGANGKAEQILSEFLGRENARLLLHELEAWLRSPYHDIREWDHAVQYPETNDNFQVENSHRESLGRPKKISRTMHTKLYNASGADADSPAREDRRRVDSYRPNDNS